ncbi:SufD family Fe-S cluster assembly protein [Synechococcus sp. CS-197]|uniref:SufD family Fe-S cluster assembly protein n=1 Tax=Synechococcus sp. CS-197 TaxID=2847985 RepID=UPI0001525C08|nr:SufD family Fe-S cluster assembly protein [Synechococcus sp. CS-197]MCT0251490.1 SufD family Fe-S cluster assembly protein [Synechococcus sp. CS-197]CAK24574.1 SufD protein, Fe-S cluster assembly [Synechococcus sp. WH 7803]
MVNTVLTPVQKRGQANLERLGLPTRRQEAWRLTDLKRLEAMASLPSVEGSAQHAWPSIHQGVTRFVIGTGVDPLEGVQLPEGVSPLSEAELEQALGHTLDRCGCAETWPVELNHARSQRVLALRVRGSVAPLEIVLAAGGGLVATRVLLLLEEKAELDLFQVIPAERESAAAPLAHSHVIEVHLGQEARLRHGVLASASDDSSLLAHLAVEQEPRSSYDFVSVCRGWRFGRLEPRVLQVDGQATTRLTGLAMTGTDEQFATHTSVCFEGPEGSLDQLQKAVAADRSHSIFNGAIQVPRAAQRTDASQLSRNLLLSNRARVDAKPELEIVADDVRCAHGATVSQLQQDQLFYLRSRGVAADEAAALLLKGYCCDVVDRLPSMAPSWLASAAINDPARPL